MKITITTDGQRQDAGLAYARKLFNDAIPDQLDEEGNRVDPKPGTIATDEEYLQIRVNDMLDSYAAQMEASDTSEFMKTDGKAALDDALAAKRDERLNEGSK